MMMMMIYIYIDYGGTKDVVVTVVGNGHGDPSSISGRGYLRFILR